MLQMKLSDHMRGELILLAVLVAALAALVAGVFAIADDVADVGAYESSADGRAYPEQP